MGLLPLIYWSPALYDSQKEYYITSDEFRTLCIVKLARLRVKIKGMDLKVGALSAWKLADEQRQPLHL